jgi:hypothetical protein
MSAGDDKLTEFERHTKEVLQASVRRIDARLRSRLNQARQAALEEASRPRRSLWQSFNLMPALGAVTAALLVALVIGYRAPVVEPTPSGPTVEDMDLLADGDGLQLVQSDGSFYEWAVEQADGEAAGNGV